MSQIHLQSSLLGIVALLGSSMLAMAGAGAGDSTKPPAQLPCLQSLQPVPTGYQFPSEKQDYEIPSGSRIGRIHYTRLPVFDESNPLENRWLYRWANRLHVITKQRVQQQQLLFDSGDPYEDRLIRESARILRSASYLADAAIRPVSHCDGSVDVEVISRDVWSLTPEVTLKRTGGKSTYRFGLWDTNILGSGKELAITSRKDVDRDSTEFLYRDPNLFGTRVTARIYYVDSDDGSTKLGRLALPFYALDTRRSWGMVAEQGARIDSQYFSAAKTSEVSHETTFYQGFYGISKGLKNGVARRFSLGYQIEEHRFFPTLALPSPAAFPADRRLSYPFLRYESIEDSYVESSNLNQIHRTEDLHLGLHLSCRIGYSSRDEKRLVLDGRLRDMRALQQNSLLQHQLNWQGFWNYDRSEAEEVLVNYGLRYFRRQTDRRSFFSSLSVAYVENISGDKQLQLGGDTGLRGYPQRYATGDRRYLLSLEQRLYTDLHILQLVRVGWVLFFDMGKAWFEGVDNGAGNELLKNVGFGLRLSSSKTESGKVLHLDIAYPMDRRDDPAVDSVQYLVTMKSSF